MKKVPANERPHMGKSCSISVINTTLQRIRIMGKKTLEDVIRTHFYIQNKDSSPQCNSFESCWNPVLECGAFCPRKIVMRQSDSFSVFSFRKQIQVPVLHFLHVWIWQ